MRRENLKAPVNTARNEAVNHHPADFGLKDFLQVRLIVDVAVQRVCEFVQCHRILKIGQRVLSYGGLHPLPQCLRPSVKD